MSGNRPGGGAKASGLAGLMAAGKLREPANGTTGNSPAGWVPRPSLTGVAPAKLEPVHVAEWDLAPDGKIFILPVDLIDDSPYQPEHESRDRYEPEGLSELAHTIAHEGQKEPIQVRRVDGRFELIAGHRRIRAVRLLGWTEIQGMIRTLDDAGAERALMVHNEGVRGDPDYRKAKRYQRALDRGYAKNQSDLAAMFAATQGTVSRRLKMLRLPAPIIALLNEDNALFGCTTGLVVEELAQQHPTKIDLLTQAVERIAKENASENSIKSWFMQMLQTQGRDASPPAERPEPHVIKDARGIRLYTAKLEGRAVKVQLHDTKAAPAVILEKVSEFLRKLTEESKTDEP